MVRGMKTTFESEIIRLADLTVTQDVLVGYTFTDCVIFGPAVLAPAGESVITDCTFSADADGLFWLVEPQREYVVGAIGLQDCRFERCRFDRVGFAGPLEMKDMLPSGGAK